MGLSAYFVFSWVGIPFSSNLVYLSFFKNISFGLTFIYIIQIFTFCSFYSYLAFCSASFFNLIAIFSSLSFIRIYFDSCFQMDGSPICLSSSLIPKSTIYSSLNLSQIARIFLQSVLAFSLMESLNFIIEFKSSSYLESPDSSVWK